MDEKRRSGTIKIYRSPGWGFISQDQSVDLFFRRGDFEFGKPQEGQRVSYSVTRGPWGLRAVKGRVLDASEAIVENWWTFVGVLPIPRKIEDQTRRSESLQAER
jgi:cold shock CspA family protein